MQYDLKKPVIERKNDQMQFLCMKILLSYYKIAKDSLMQVYSQLNLFNMLHLNCATQVNQTSPPPTEAWSPGVAQN